MLIQGGLMQDLKNFWLTRINLKKTAKLIARQQILIPPIYKKLLKKP